MICFDNLADLEFLGRQGTEYGKVLTLKYSKCVGKEHCKSADEIDSFLHDHRMILLFNQQDYESENYGDGSHIRRYADAIFKDFDFDKVKLATLRI